MAETQQLREDFVECRSHRLWKKQALPDTRPTFMVCALRWTERVCFAMNFRSRRSGLHYLASVHARGRKPVSAEKQQINFHFNSMCNTQNTCLLSFHLRDIFLAHALLLETAFNHAKVRWKYSLRNVDYLKGRKCKQCVLQLCWRWMYCNCVIWLLTQSIMKEIFSLWNVHLWLISYTNLFFIFSLKLISRLKQHDYVAR